MTAFEQPLEILPMHPMSTVAGALLIAVVALAVWSDLRVGRIPNTLTVTAFIAALALRLALGGGAFLDGLLGAALAFAVILPLFAMGGLGGGDGKLLVAIGAFLGPSGLVIALLATALAGGAMAVVAAIRQGVILPALFNTGRLLKYVLTLGRRGERTTRESAGAVTVPYAVAIACGSLFALWYGGGV